MSLPWENELEFLKRQALDAGAIMRRHFKGEFKVYTKPDRSKVTDVDLEISEMVQERSRKAFPEVVLFSEESENPPIDVNRDHFIVDELDGTSYFIHKNKGFSHQAAFYKGGEGLKLGLVYFPVDDILLYGVRGYGAFYHHNGESRPLPAPDLDKPFGSLHYAHPARYRGEKYRDLVEALGGQQDQIVLTTALRTLQFAEGVLDVAIFLMRRIPEWDWAGEKVIVEELGYNHSYLDGSPIRFGEPPVQDNPGYLICPPRHREHLISESLSWVK